MIGTSSMDKRGLNRRFPAAAWISRMGLLAWLSSAALAGTFGTVVQIGGEAADLALDEPRGVLYIADFTANRIDVMSLSSQQIVQRISVAPHPNSISRSPNGRWLLVAHYGNNADPAPQANSLTLIDLTRNNFQSSIALADPPLAVAFGSTNRALIVTTSEYIEFDPTQGTLTILDTIANVTAKTLPQPPASFPPDITGSSVTVSGDGTKAFGMISATSTVTFRYDFPTQTVSPGGVVLASGILGPRVVSTNQDATLSIAGWVEVDRNHVFVNYMNQSDNEFSVGTTLFDPSRELVYAQLPFTKGEAPTLMLLNEYTFAVGQRLKLPENTTGKSVLSSDTNTMYALSSSGVMVLPVGSLASTPRIQPPAQSLLFASNLCDASSTSQTVTITDPGGGNTPFSIKSPFAGVTVSPASGTTPADVTVTVNPAAFASHGTTEIDLTVSSPSAVNVIAPLKVLVNRADPDQKGAILNVPGVLTQVVGDSARDRYYVLREDNNSVLLFDASNNTQIGTLPTLNSPATLAITRDNKHLLVGHKQSQTVLVYDLDSLSLTSYIPTSDGLGQEARSIAVSGRQILTTAVDYQKQGHVEAIDLVNGVATQPKTLGVWTNTISTDSVATASSDGSKILIASSDGTLLTYDANADTYTFSRKDFGGLMGAYAASGDRFLVDGHLLNSALVLTSDLDASNGQTSGFLFGDGGIVRTLAPNPASPGVIERIDASTGASFGTTRTVEAPLLTTGVFDPSAFTKTLIAVPNHSYYLSLSTSGLMMLPWDFDASLASPMITKVVSAADGQSPPASGSLVSIFGQDLSRSNLAETGYPLPFELGQTCVLVGTQKIPLLLVSPTQINAQIPYEAVGPVQMSVRMQDGASPAFSFTVLSASPVIFETGTAGPLTNIPLIYRTSANGLLVTASNPIHWEDTLTIHLAGMGATSPAVADGAPAPDSPPSQVIVPAVVTLGGVDLPVASATLVPGQVGVYELQVKVPKNTPLGLSVPLTVSQGGISQTTNVRVVQ